MLSKDVGNRRHMKKEWYYSYWSFVMGKFLVKKEVMVEKKFV